MNNRFVFLGASLGIALLAACSSSPTSSGSPHPGCEPLPSGTGTSPSIHCDTGTHFETSSCSCVPDSTCADPGICGSGMEWSTTHCACEPVDHCDIACPVGTEQAEDGCGCIPLDGGPPPVCFIPGYGSCGIGQSCVVAYCPDDSPISCFCDAQGNTSCTGACEDPDGGPPPPPPVDGGPPPPFDGGQGCWLPGIGYCAPNTSCITGYCPDNVTPVSCFCEGNGVSQCTGACPPDPPHVDAGTGGH